MSSSISDNKTSHNYINLRLYLSMCLPFAEIQSVRLTLSTASCPFRTEISAIQWPLVQQYLVLGRFHISEKRHLNNPHRHLAHEVLQSFVNLCLSVLIYQQSIQIQSISVTLSRFLGPKREPLETSINNSRTRMTILP